MFSYGFKSRSIVAPNVITIFVFVPIRICMLMVIFISICILLLLPLRRHNHLISNLNTPPCKGTRIAISGFDMWKYFIT